MLIVINQSQNSSTLYKFQSALLLDSKTVTMNIAKSINFHINNQYDSIYFLFRQRSDQVQCPLRNVTNYAYGGCHVLHEGNIRVRRW